MGNSQELTAVVADRMAVEDVLIRYFELVDAKDWDRMHEVFTDDTTARWTADAAMEGLDNVVGAIQHMIANDEVVTFHHVSSMAPRIDGDTAEVNARVRAMHSGVGPRAGKFYESLAFQPTRLVRTSEGWRISHHDWLIQVKLGSMEELFAPELAARAKH